MCAKGSVCVRVPQLAAFKEDSFKAGGKRWVGQAPLCVSAVEFFPFFFLLPFFFLISFLQRVRCFFLVIILSLQSSKDRVQQLFSPGERLSSFIQLFFFPHRKNLVSFALVIVIAIVTCVCVCVCVYQSSMSSSLSKRSPSMGTGSAAQLPRVSTAPRSARKKPASLAATAATCWSPSV